MGSGKRAFSHLKNVLFSEYHKLLPPTPHPYYQKRPQGSEPPVEASVALSLLEKFTDNDGLLLNDTYKYLRANKVK